MPDLNIIPSAGSTDGYHYLEREADRDRAPSNRAMVRITPDMIAWLDAIGAEMGRRMVEADERLRARLAAEREARV